MILFVQTLRTTVQAVRESSTIDPAHPGIMEFQRLLNEEIARLEKGRKSTYITS